MYTIYVDGELLYTPTLAQNGYCVLNPKLVVELNKSGSLTFLLPPNNVRYGHIQKLKSVVTVFQDDEEIFRGRVLHDTRDFYNRKEVYCEGELSFLLDSIQIPYNFDGNYGDFFKKLIDTHNEQVDEFKQFMVGTIDDSDKQYVCDNSNYTNTLDELSSKLVGNDDRYLRIRSKNGNRYIDCVKAYGNTIKQTIEFGVNMLDISEYISADEVFTVLLPIGSTAKSYGTGAEYKFTHVSCNSVMIHEDTDDGSKYTCPTCGLSVTLSDYGVPKCSCCDRFMLGSRDNSTPSYATDYSCSNSSCDNWGKKLRKESYSGVNEALDSVTIGSVTDLSSLPDGIIKNGDRLEDEAAIALFGRICKVQQFDESDPVKLMKLGAESLKSGIEMAVSLTVKAVDLHFLNVTTERIKIGHNVKVISKPHNLEKDFLCSKIDYDLANPDKTEFTLGTKHTTLTTNQVEGNKTIQNTVSTVDRTSAESKATSEKTNTVLSETMSPASIFKLLTDNGKFQGIIKDEETGDIYINASYIKSGKLTLGGDNPSFEVVNDDGIVCVRADKDGIHILEGEVRATSGALENMTIVNGITISSKDEVVKGLSLISIEPYNNEAGGTSYRVVFGDSTTKSNTVVFDFDDVHLKNALHFDRDNTEKQIHFKTKTDEGTYSHNCKIYGGNATSPIGIGVYSYEDGTPKRVWAYDDQLRHLVSDVPLASYDLDITLGDGASDVDNHSICQQLTRAAHIHARFYSKGIAANTTATLGTISTDYAPKEFDVILSAFTASTTCSVFITTKGRIRIKSPNAIAAGETIFIDGCWIY